MNKDFLKKMYYNPQFGLSSPKVLYDKIKKDYPKMKITLKEIKDFTTAQSVNQIYSNSLFK